jgi:hypothetical protein
MADFSIRPLPLSEKSPPLSRKCSKRSDRAFLVRESHAGNIAVKKAKTGCDKK